MGGLSSLTQGALSGIGKVKGQSRILEAEIRLDASRGVVIPRKQESLEMLKEQEKTAMNYLAEAVTQDSENIKKFLDSSKETMDKINEEAKKQQEEEKATKTTEESTQSNAATEEKQNAAESTEAGAIVDVTIPSTVVSSDFANPDKDNDEQSPAVNVSA